MNKSMNVYFSDFHSDFPNNSGPDNCSGFKRTNGKMLITRLNDASFNSFQERNAWLAFLENQRSSFGDSAITDYRRSSKLHLGLINQSSIKLQDSFSSTFVSLAARISQFIVTSVAVST